MRIFLFQYGSRKSLWIFLSFRRNHILVNITGERPTLTIHKKRIPNNIQRGYLRTQTKRSRIHKNGKIENSFYIQVLIIKRTKPFTRRTELDLYFINYCHKEYRKGKKEEGGKEGEEREQGGGRYDGGDTIKLLT